MPTLFFPDISGFQAGISLAGIPAVIVKATEGTSFTNSDYVPAIGRAASHGIPAFAYHFLHSGNASAQAQHAFTVVGKRPLMLDWEPTGTSRPSVADATAFVDAYRKLGGVVYALYFPHWYWQQLGSPSLSGFVSRGMFLVTSDYVAYSDNGPGWNGYGGMSVGVWQYTSTHSLNGFSQVDFNAFKGTVAQLVSLFGGIVPKPESLVLRLNDSGPAVTYLQQRLNVWGDKLTVDGLFGPATQACVNAFQLRFALTPDGVVGPVTWAALDKSPGTVTPALTGLAVASKVTRTDLTVKWNPLVIAGVTVPSYTVTATGLNKVVYATAKTTSASVTLNRLVPGWQYDIKVQAEGGPSATFRVTV